jgi:hypothetical protein
MSRLTASVAVGCALFAAGVGVWPTTAHADDIARCNPASPLFDARLCYYGPNHHGNYSCDPYGDAYNSDYCAGTSR